MRVYLQLAAMRTSIHYLALVLHRSTHHVAQAVPGKRHTCRRKAGAKVGTPAPCTCGALCWCAFGSTSATLLTLSSHAVTISQACCGQPSALVVIFAHDGQVLGLVFVDVPQRGPINGCDLGRRLVHDGCDHRLRRRNHLPRAAAGSVCRAPSASSHGLSERLQHSVTCHMQQRTSMSSALSQLHGWVSFCGSVV